MSMSRDERIQPQTQSHTFYGKCSGCKPLVYIAQYDIDISSVMIHCDRLYKVARVLDILINA